jgi:hypothetical protein
LVDLAAGPSTLETYAHTGLTPGTTYYYSAFAYDSAQQYAAPAHASATPLSPADLDRDDDVDQTDFGQFQACFSGTGELPPEGCENADLDGDHDVDAQDLESFVTCLAGADQAPGC